MVDEKPRTVDEAREAVLAQLVRTSPTSWGGRVLDYDGEPDPEAVAILDDYRDLVRADAEKQAREEMPCYRGWFLDQQPAGAIDLRGMTCADMKPEAFAESACPSCKAREGDAGE